ncbi:MAG: shikimate kinase [Syntrophobacteraceae bacterium]
MKPLNLALIGFRATGKTTVGQILALSLKRSFIDMDRRLVEDAGLDITAWVARNGWSSFRRAESGLLETLRLHTNLVLATGGGIVLDPKNREALRKDFFTVWLKATRHTILARLDSDPQSRQTRPALSPLPLEEEVLKILCEREPFYTESADLAIDTDSKAPSRIAREIEEGISVALNPV